MTNAAKIDYLTRLPTELLLMICEHIVVQKDDIEMGWPADARIPAKPPHPALCQVNQRLRTLTLPLFHEKNTFQHLFDDYDRSVGLGLAEFAESRGSPSIFAISRTRYTVRKKPGRT